jgi:hypothetical protein
LRDDPTLLGNTQALFGAQGFDVDLPVHERPLLSFRISRDKLAAFGAMRKGGRPFGPPPFLSVVALT